MPGHYPQPVCGPARAVLQTGKYATRTGCYRNAIALEDDGRTLAHLLSEGGCSTNYIGKWHLSLDGLEPVPAAHRCGYMDEWKAADLLEFTSDAYGGYLYDRENRRISFEGRYRTDVLTGYAADFLHNYDDERPFFLMLSYLEPHHQNTQNRYIAPHGYAERYKDAPPPPDLLALDKPDADWRANLVDYYGCVRRLDENLQTLVETLKQTGLYDDTIILFTSDHGCHFRTRNGEYKRSCHEASVRIPLVIYGGAYRGGGIVEHPVSLADLAPTILEMAGLAPDIDMDGRPLARVLENPTDWDDDVLIQISESEVGRALRTPRWKYGVTAPHKDGWRESKSDLYVEDFLYDLASDPYELDNLVADPDTGTVRRKLRAALLEKMRQAQEAATIILPLVP